MNDVGAVAHVDLDAVQPRRARSATAAAEPATVAPIRSRMRDEFDVALRGARRARARAGRTVVPVSAALARK